MISMKNGVWILFAALIFTACENSSYRKTPGGMPYKIYRGDDTAQVRVGDYIKVLYTQTIRDSVYFTTEGTLPIYLKVDPKPQPYDISEIWTSLRVGDSIIATQMIDTFIKRMPQSIPPEFKNGMRIITTVKILQVFTSDSAVKADDERSRAVLLTEEIKTVEKYLADKKINAQKTPSGAYVELVSPGSGPMADSGKNVTVNYTGTSWSGKKFDSNVDTTFNHVAPYSFVAGSGRMIKGFDEAMFFMNKGAKVKVYIPSTLAYGANPNSPNIKPFEHLIFEIELLDIQDKGPDQQLPPAQPMNIDPSQSN